MSKRCCTGVFLLYDVQKAYAKFVKEHKKHPTYLIVGDRDYHDMSHWAWSISYTKGFVPSESYEDSCSKFHRLFNAGVFSSGDIVLRIEHVPGFDGFSLEENLDY